VLRVDAFGDLVVVSWVRNHHFPARRARGNRSCAACLGAHASDSRLAAEARRRALTAHRLAHRGLRHPPPLSVTP
jgi:hypothetical protein